MDCAITNLAGGAFLDAGPSAASFTSGKLTDSCVFVMIPESDGVVLKRRGGSGYLCAAAGGFALVHDSATAATRFRFIAVADTRSGFMYAMCVTHNDMLTYVTVSRGGFPSLTRDPLLAAAVSVTDAPVVASVTVRHALNALHGSQIALWGGVERGWLTAHPVTSLGGGDVTSRETALAAPMWFKVHVFDSVTGAVALRSIHSRWLCCHDDGELRADSMRVERGEVFFLEPAGPSHGRLRTVHGSYVSASSERVGTALKAGPCEHFVLVDLDGAHLYSGTNPAFVDAPRSSSGGLQAGGLALALLAGAAILTGQLVAMLSADCVVTEADGDSGGAARGSPGSK